MPRHLVNTWVIAAPPTVAIGIPAVIIVTGTIATATTETTVTDEVILRMTERGTVILTEGITEIGGTGVVPLEEGIVPLLVLGAGAVTAGAPHAEVAAARRSTAPLRMRVATPMEPLLTPTEGGERL